MLSDSRGRRSKAKPAPPAGPARASLRQRVGLWLLFALILAWPFALKQFWGVHVGFGDVHLYRLWALQGVEDGRWPVLDFDWVYPIGALIPLVALSPLAGSEIYESLFIGLILFANAVIMMELRDRVSVRAALWWLIFLLLLGPIAYSRLDGVAAALATVALLAVVKRPKLATVLILAAAWIKVAHAAWMIPLLVCSRRRLRDVVVPAIVVTLLIGGVALALGANKHLLSFVSGQSDRRLQIESVGATPFQVVRWLGQPSGLTGNIELATWEFHNRMADHVATALGIALPIAVLGVGVLTILAVRRGRVSAQEILLLSILATTAALIVFNKVGSPQFIVWLSSPAVASFALDSHSDGTWRRLRALTLVIAAATQVVFPIGYDALIDGQLWPLLALVMRNVALVVLLALTCRLLWSASRLVPAATVT